MDPFSTTVEHRAELLAHFSTGPAWIRELTRNAAVKMYASRFGLSGSDVFMYVRPEDVRKSGRRSWDLERFLRKAVVGLMGESEVQLFRLLPYPQEETDLNPTQEIGLNNCFFKTEQTLQHDELRFRSKAEIAIHTELSKRRLLFFPNAAAVLGGERPVKREPDFLVCFEGRWGILEVMGDSFHNSSTAAKDHERARLFKGHGVLCMEFFSAAECAQDPKAVVDRFLGILSKF
jgi:hypothetical protein